MLTYAVGDIHGCRQLLDRLLALIAADAAGRERRLVFLGDMIDRGPDSAGAVATLRALQAVEPERVVCLKGNHEDLLGAAVRDPAAADLWLCNGGVETLASYGVANARDIPPADLAWLTTLPTSHEDERRIYVHAGLKPGRALADQHPNDLVWIRHEFLDSDADHGKLVVHGHTPRRTGRPDHQPNRLNLDTAAVYGGRLTAAVFVDDETSPVRFLQVP